MVTLEECAEYCRNQAERFKNATMSEVIGRNSDRLLAEWRRQQEIFEMLAKVVEIAIIKHNTGGNV